MPVFQYHQDILTRFPNTVGGIIVGTGLANGATPRAFHELYVAEQQIIIQQIGNIPLSEIPALAAWRQTFRGFGVDPTQYRSAAEALLRRLTKKGDIPSINLLVDIGNFICIRYKLPTAICDARAIQGTITVKFAEGNEYFTELDSSEIIHPNVGEVVFSDNGGMVLARRWCWRQSAQSASIFDTTDILITIEAMHENGRKDVEVAVDDILVLLKQYAGGEYRHAILDKTNPAIE